MVFENKFQELLIKNVKVEFLRFLSAILIMLCHMYMLDGSLVDWPFKGGYIAVEFFFFLTGYFTVAHWDKLKKAEDFTTENAAQYATKYMAQKILKVVPYTTLTFIITYSYFFILNNDISIRKSLVSAAVWDFLLLQTTGLSFYNYIQPIWYVSALLIVLPVFSFICIKFNDEFKYIIVWMAPSLIYGYFCKLGRGIASDHVLLRTFAGLCIGALCFYISKYIKANKQFNMKIHIKAGILLTTLGAIYLAYFEKHSNEDFIIIILYGVQIILLSLDSADFKNNLINRLCVFLGKISLPMYIIHTFIFIIVRDTFTFNLKVKFITATLITVITASVLVIIEQLIRSRMSHKKGTL